MRYLLAFLLIVACNTPEPTYQTGKVVRIADGDTFTYLAPGNKQIKVRLYGIDCPEKAQPFGTVARQALSNLVFGQTVRIEQRDVDRYGRTVAIVYNSQDQNVNEAMLREGFAWHYTEYDQNRDWDKLQQQAKQKKLGLWADPHPTPPWLWRKEKREAAVN